MEDNSIRYVVIGGPNVKDKWNDESIGKSCFIDNIYYQVDRIEYLENSRGNSRVGLTLSPLEGVKLLEAELETEKAKVNEPQRKNVNAFIRALNEDMVDVVSIIPLQLGEQFTRFLRDEIFEECYDEDYCKFSYKHKVRYDEDWNEWSFGYYKFLVIYRYDDINYFHFYRSLNEMSFDIEKDTI